MKLLVDTNIIISALISDSITRKIIFKEFFELISPDFLIEEVYKYKLEICKKSSINEQEFDMVVKNILKYINIIPSNKYEDAIKDVDDLINDPKDVVFLACAVAYNVDGIWTEDKEFKKQNKIKVYTTKDVVEIIIK